MLNSIKNISKQYEQAIAYEYGDTANTTDYVTADLDLSSGKNIKSIKVVAGGKVNNQYGTFDVSLSGGSSYSDIIVSGSGTSANAFNGTAYYLQNTKQYANVRYIRASVKGNLSGLTNCTVVLVVTYE